MSELPLPHDPPRNSTGTDSAAGGVQDLGPDLGWSPESSEEPGAWNLKIAAGAGPEEEKKRKKKISPRSRARGGSSTQRWDQRSVGIQGHEGFSLDC